MFLGYPDRMPIGRKRRQGHDDFTIEWGEKALKFNPDAYLISSHLITTTKTTACVILCVCVCIYMPCTPTNTFPLRMQANPQIGQRTCHSNFTTFKAPWVGGSPRLPTLGAFSNIYPQFSC